MPEVVNPTELHQLARRVVEAQGAPMTNENVSRARNLLASDSEVYSRAIQQYMPGFEGQKRGPDTGPRATMEEFNTKLDEVLIGEGETSDVSQRVQQQPGANGQAAELSSQQNPQAQTQGVVQEAASVLQQSGNRTGTAPVPTGSVAPVEIAMLPVQAGQQPLPEAFDASAQQAARSEIEARGNEQVRERADQDGIPFVPPAVMPRQQQQAQTRTAIDAFDDTNRPIDVEFEVARDLPPGEASRQIEQRLAIEDGTDASEGEGNRQQAQQGTEGTTTRTSRTPPIEPDPRIDGSIKFTVDGKSFNVAPNGIVLNETDNLVERRPDVLARVKAFLQQHGHEFANVIRSR